MTSIALPPLSATLFQPRPFVDWTFIRSLSILVLLPLALCAWLLRSRLNRVKKRVPSFSVPDENEKTRLKATGSTWRGEKPKESKAKEIQYTDHFPRLETLAEDATVQERERMVVDKELYWKMQNLEDHPGTSPVSPLGRLLFLQQKLAQLTSRCRPPRARPSA